MRIEIRKELSGRILDIGGGGEGVIGRVYGPQVTAVDISAEELAEAPEGFEKLVMDAKSMSFPDNSFDHVTAFYSFLFIPKPEHEQVVSEIARVLRPGGTLHVWDCEVRSAYPEPFTVDLDVDADGEQIHATYGVMERDCVQSAERLIALCGKTKLLLEGKEIREGSFFLRFRKTAALAEAVSLRPMTAEMYHAYYRDYENDPDLFLDKSRFKPFVYSPEWVDSYAQRQRDRNRRCFAVMYGDEMAGEIIIKDIEPGKSAALGICMKNDRYKGRGIGTRAEQLAIDYVFREMDIPVLYADSVLTNTRSQHVLEKAGFQLLRTEGDFKYYSIERRQDNSGQAGEAF